MPSWTPSWSQPATTSAASARSSRARTWNGHRCSLRNRARASRSAAVTGRKFGSGMAEW